MANGDGIFTTSLAEGIYADAAGNRFKGSVPQKR